MSVGRWAAQVILYLTFFAAIGYFSQQPLYQHLPVDQATIKLSLRHAGQIVGECQERSAEQLAQLPENMRVPLVCPRRRSPLDLELRIDGQLRYADRLEARGIHQDGRASVYRRLNVAAGEMLITVKLKDDLSASDFQYVSHRRVSLPPGSNLVIDFDEQAGEFEFLLPAGSSASDQRAALQNTLNDLEADDGQHQNDAEIDHVPVGQRFATALLDQPDNPVGQKVEPDGRQGKQ